MVAGASDRAVPGRTRGRAASAILSAQMLISAVVLILIAAALIVDAESFTSPGLFAGLGLVFVLTAVAAVVPWDVFDKRWGLMLDRKSVV